MAVIDDVLQSIADTIEKISEASAAARAAVAEADTGLEAATAFGVTASVEGMTAVKEKLETLVTELDSVGSVAEDAQTVGLPTTLEGASLREALADRAAPLPAVAKPPSKPASSPQRHCRLVRVHRNRIDRSDASNRENRYPRVGQSSLLRISASEQRLLVEFGEYFRPS